MAGPSGEMKKKSRKGAAPGGARTGGAKREEALALAREVERVRGLLKEVSEAVLVRLDGRAAALYQVLTGEGLPEAPSLPAAERLRRLNRAAASLKVKPPKGRVKDLARLEALLEALEESLLP